jgi:hypothetical protein
MYEGGATWIEQFLLEYHRSSSIAAGTATIAPTPQRSTQYETELHFIPANQLQQRDYFSDSWLISKQRLLEIDVRRIAIVEDAAFVAVGRNAKRPYRYAKMTLDWMDFCVEHLSKWWGALLYQRNRSVVSTNLLEHVVDALKQYIQEKVQPPTHPTPLAQTIAMVAFAPYKKKMNETQSHILTTHSLASTIASLYQVGFGRVVVVGIQAEDIKYVQGAANILIAAYNMEPQHDGSTNDANFTLAKIGNTQMEVAFVHVQDPTWIATRHVAMNIPRAAVIGMKLALSNVMNATEMSHWLGAHRGPSYWHSVYLTEPDTILHVRPALLPAFRDALSRGTSLFPHRLHPIAHEADLPQSHSLNAGLFLPNIEHFSNISIMDTSVQIMSKDAKSREPVYASCCDGGKEWPMLSKKKCHPWWSCSFKPIQEGELNGTEMVQRHELFELYPMMVRLFQPFEWQGASLSHLSLFSSFHQRIRNGIGPVFASTNHGRRCIPSKSPCWMNV